MVKFDYLPDGRIVGLRDVFASFNEPSGPVPEEIGLSPASRMK
jgi:DNA polymerase-3 subunit epsilon